MDVHLHRVNRVVAATGPGGGSLPPAARAWLEDALTYYERHYDFAGGDGAGGFEMIARKLYSVDPRTGAVLFPIGLRPRVYRGLATAGHKVTYTGGTLTEANAAAYALDWDGLFADFNVYDDQGVCLSRIIASDGGIIGAITGWGKSVLLRMMCRLLYKSRIHVVTKSRTLAQEIHRDLETVFPQVGFIGDGKKKTGRITVFVADSLRHGSGEADIVIADELHELLAPKYAGLLGMYTKARMFGLSATPTGRSDNRDIVGEALFGPLLYTISYQEAEAQGRVVPITVEWLRVPTGPDVGHIRLPALREQVGVWQNATRNAAIAARVRQFEPDEQVLIMVKTIEHAVRLKALLPGFTLAYAKDGLTPDRLKGYVAAGLLPPDEPLMTGDRPRRLREQFAAGTLKKVIANYVWSTGVNFRQLAVLVRADAAASEIRDGQIPGRICRRVPGVKEAALLIDVWDEWSDAFGNRSRSRRRNYTKRGWAQVWPTPTPVGPRT